MTHGSCIRNRLKAGLQAPFQPRLRKTFSEVRSTGFTSPPKVFARPSHDD